ncbi:unnamed protein product [Durusdinium trenchii]|uniref:FHA domain-containing protein n=1 Tax=Durusdinium trenchii TaxID=1381693 RepID=A0ABP0H6Z0_9DINO
MLALFLFLATGLASQLPTCWDSNITGLSIDCSTGGFVEVRVRALHGLIVGQDAQGISYSQPAGARQIGEASSTDIGDDRQDWAILSGDCQYVNSRLPTVTYKRCSDNVLRDPYEGFDTVHLQACNETALVREFRLAMGLARLEADLAAVVRLQRLQPTTGPFTGGTSVNLTVSGLSGLNQTQVCAGRVAGALPSRLEPQGSPICVFAPYLVLLEAALGDSIEADPRWHQLLEAVGSSLCAELAGNGVLAAVHWKPRQAGQSHRRVMAALILADPAVCHTLRQQHWSRVRRFLRDQAFVRWKDGLDTADPERSKGHCRQLLDALQLRRVESPGFALELPVEWLEGMAEKPHARCSAVRAQCPWERFFQHFGPLSLLERVLTEPGRAVLLACFQDPAAAEAIYECLAGRCLYFPWRETCTDCFPVLCALRDYDTLKAQLYRQEQLQDEEPAYLLRRLGERPPKPSPPEAILVTSSRGTWRCGREGVEISLRAAHVSKVHAVLELSRQGTSWRLTVQDLSTNGTWVNGKKLSPQEKQPLTRNDQICFVPPANGVEPLVYEVVPLP